MNLRRQFFIAPNFDQGLVKKKNTVPFVQKTGKYGFKATKLSNIFLFSAVSPPLPLPTGFPGAKIMPFSS